MNKRGYTLVEVIVSVMILSIASAILAGSFGTVIHFMSQSNTIKNESNVLYSYIEGSDEASIRNSVIQTDKKITYKLNSISVSGTMSEFQSKKTDKVTLKQFYSDNIKLLKELPVYQNLASLSNEMQEQLIKLQNDDSKKDFILTDGLNYILKSLYIDSYAQQFDIFPKSLLPEKINATQLYIRALYPWEQVSNGGLITSGGCLIYATEHGVGSVSSLNNRIYLVYDPVGKVWYYNGDSANTYTVNYNTSYPVFDKNNTTTDNTFFSINGNHILVKSWSELLEHIKNESNGWKQLDGDLVYNANDSINKYWVKVKK